MIAVTDHYRVDESKGLVQAAREAGLFAFSGFEAVTKDGVHTFFVCLIAIRRVFSNGLLESVGFTTRDTSPTGSLDSTELACPSEK